jgi:hypothetical protein
VNEITLDVARERAAETLDQLRRAINPKKKRAADLTLGRRWMLYLAAGTNLRPASIWLYRYVVSHYLSAWMDMPLRDIAVEKVEKRHLQLPAMWAGGQGPLPGAVAKAPAFGSLNTGSLAAPLKPRSNAGPSQRSSPKYK